MSGARCGPSCHGASLRLGRHRRHPQTVTDRTHAKGTGPIGTRRRKGRGDKLHDALVMDPAGVPLGICAVIDWQRPQTPARRSPGRRDVDQKETRYWLQARDQVRTRLREHAPDVVLHLLHDREADSWTVLWDVVTHQDKEFTTVRAHWNRRLVCADPIDERMRGRCAMRWRVRPFAASWSLWCRPEAVSPRASRRCRCARVASRWTFATSVTKHTARRRSTSSVSPRPRRRRASLRWSGCC